MVKGRIAHAASHPHTSPRRFRLARHVGRSSDLRAVARTPWPTSVASQLVEESVLMTRSFPITAAGQSRYFTGFPLATPDHRRTDAV